MAAPHAVTDQDLDEPAEAAADDDAGPSADAPHRSPALVLAVTLAVLCGAAAAILGVLAARGGGGDERIEAVRQTAGQFGEALVTYDYRDPDSHRSAVLALSTGSFRDEYEDAFDQGLAEIITEVEAVSVGFVKDVYVSELDEERAQAIVVVDIEHSGAGGPRTLYDVYFRLTFVEVDGVWKVDQVTDLNFDTGSTTAPSSTSTSIP